MNRKSNWLIALLLLVVAQGAWHKSLVYPTWKRDYMPKSEGVAVGLDPTQLLAAMAGFRELVAGILWVRADSFFDTGNYDAVLPIIRLVTWLDPHQLDVYATGMWHIAYNFTDEESRSDRRYVPAAIALGKEGARKNPNTYELFFETGWLWYHKVDDLYGNAVKWFEDANERDDMLPARRNLLSNAYQRDGRVDDALKLYTKLYSEASEMYLKNPEIQYRQIRDTLESNLDTLVVRMVQRGYLAQQRSDGSFATSPYDVKPPFDVGFSVRATVEDAKVIRFEGSWNVLPVGTRIRVVLKDSDFPKELPGGADWDWSDSVDLDPDPKLTYMQEQLYVKNRRFNKKVDMSRDPTMYPFTKQEYLLDFFYNPRSSPPHMQDKFGFNGEGITDKHHLNTEVRPGQRVIFARLKLTRDQIMRRGEWRDRTPVVETVGFVQPSTATLGNEEVITVPNMRAPGAAGDRPPNGAAPTNPSSNSGRRPAPIQP